MKKSKYSEQQIISLLKEVELGAKVVDVCRKYGISEATYYKWKAAYGGMDVSQLGQLCALQDLAQFLTIEHGLSARQVCRTVRLSRSILCYQPKPRNDGPVIEAVMGDITKNPRHGFGLLYSSFVNMQHPWGKTVLWRIYCELNLNLPRQGKKRLPERIREPLDVPSMPNKTWSVDFMTDALWSGRRFRIFNLLERSTSH